VLQFGLVDRHQCVGENQYLQLYCCRILILILVITPLFVLTVPPENAVAHLPGEAFLAVGRINLPATWNPHIYILYIICCIYGYEKGPGYWKVSKQSNHERITVLMANSTEQVAQLCFNTCTI
jgi:hypothetical protein